MAIIKNGSITQNTWRHLGNDEPATGSNITVSLDRWLSEHGQLVSGPLGVRLASDSDLNKIASELDQIPLIVLEMAAFTDGRVFSQARLLKERMGFKGELRVIGDYLRDQMFYLSRVGVDAFEFPEGTDLEDRLTAFREFTVTYQGAVDEPRPLFLR